jgi:uncharacterized membrane protein
MSDQNEQVVYTQEDIDTNKTMGIIAYFIFFLPLLVEPAKNSPYAKFHVNNMVLIILGNIAIWIIGLLPLLGWLAAFVGGIALFVFWIIGLIGAINGEAKKLPLIGDIVIIK